MPMPKHEGASKFIEVVKTSSKSKVCEHTMDWMEQTIGCRALEFVEQVLPRLQMARPENQSALLLGFRSAKRRTRDQQRPFSAIHRLNPYSRFPELSQIRNHAKVKCSSAPSAKACCRSYLLISLQPRLPTRAHPVLPGAHWKKEIRLVTSRTLPFPVHPDLHCYVTPIRFIRVPFFVVKHINDCLPRFRLPGRMLLLVPFYVKLGLVRTATCLGQTLCRLILCLGQRRRCEKENNDQWLEHGLSPWSLKS